MEIQYAASDDLFLSAFVNNYSPDIASSDDHDIFRDIFDTSVGSGWARSVCTV